MPSINGRSTRSASNTDAASYTIAPTLVSGRLVIVDCASQMASGGAPNTPTISDTAGNSWTQIATCTEASAGGDMRLTKFWAIANADGASTITLDFDGQTQRACCLSVDQLRNFNAADPFTETNLQTQDLTAAASTTATLPNSKASTYNVAHVSVVCLANSNTMAVTVATDCAGQMGASAPASDNLSLLTAINPEALATTVTHVSAIRCSIIIEVNHDGSGITGGAAGLMVHPGHSGRRN